MSSKQRQDKILEIMELQGYVTVKKLCECLHYSTATINRDLNELQQRRLITRSYGGAEIAHSVYVPISLRTHKMRVEKRQIGQTAASFVNDGDTIFIDGSTTAQCMKQYITSRKGLTVITNNMLLAIELGKYDIRVICLGGEISEAPCMLCGTETVENAARYRVDKMFFSTGAVSSDGKIASGVVYDLMLKTVASNASEVFYLVDSKKVDKPFNTVYGDLSDVSCVISDFEFPKCTKEMYGNTHFVNTNKCHCDQNTKEE